MKSMKLLTIFTAIAAAALALGGCVETESQTANNSNRNSNVSTVNTVTNSVSNAVNAVGNSIGNATATVTTPEPADFMMSAAQGGIAEVEAGKLAGTKGENAEVKKFGRMMVADHGKANTELKALAAKKNVPLPTDLGSHKSTVDELKGLSGAEFDKAYVDAMVEDHETTVADFTKQAENSIDPEVKAFAVKTLPTLKKHLEQIKGIKAKMP